MEIFPNLLSETEFKLFTAETYSALKGVLDDVLCGYLREYLAQPNTDAYVVDCIQNFLGHTIETMTFHNVLKERGIVELVSKISPETILSAEMNLKDAREKLEFLYANEGKCLTHIPSRTKEAWETFYAAMENLVARALATGETLQYPDLVERVKANKFIFYIPNGKSHSTGCGVINSRRRQWLICLRGLQYMEYCDANNVSAVARRVF